MLATVDNPLAAEAELDSNARQQLDTSSDLGSVAADVQAWPPRRQIVEGKDWGMKEAGAYNSTFLQAAFDFAGDGQSVNQEQYQSLHLLLGTREVTAVQDRLDLDAFVAAMNECDLEPSAMEAVGFASSLFANADECVRTLMPGNFDEPNRYNTDLVDFVAKTLDKNSVWGGLDAEDFEKPIEWGKLWDAIAVGSIQQNKDFLSGLSAGAVLQRFRDQARFDKDSHQVYVYDEDGHATDCEGQVRVLSSDEWVNSTKQLMQNAESSVQKSAKRPDQQHVATRSLQSAMQTHRGKTVAVLPKSGTKFTFAVLERHVQASEINKVRKRTQNENGIEGNAKTELYSIVLQLNDDGHGLERRAYPSKALCLTDLKPSHSQEYTVAEWNAGYGRYVYTKEELICEIVNRTLADSECTLTSPDDIEDDVRRGGDKFFLDKQSVLNLFHVALNLFDDHNNLQARLTQTQMNTLWTAARKKSATKRVAQTQFFADPKLHKTKGRERDVALDVVSKSQFLDVMVRFEGELNVDEEALTAALVGFGAAVTLVMLMYTYVATKAMAPLLCYKSCGIDWLDRGDSGPLRCDSEEYALLWRNSVVVTILFAFGLPVFIFIKLWSRSELIYTEFPQGEYYHFKLTWGWLFARYREECWWYEAKVLSHKLLSSVIASVLVEQPDRAVRTLIGLQLLALMVHVAVLPYPDMYSNIMESFFLLVEFINALIAFHSTKDGDDMHWFWEGVITLLNIIVLAPAVPDVLTLGLLSVKKLKTGLSSFGCRDLEGHHKELLAVVFVTSALSFNLLFIGIGIGSTTEDFPMNAEVLPGETCAEGWTNFSMPLVACEQVKMAVSAGTDEKLESFTEQATMPTELQRKSGYEWVCHEPPWLTADSFVPGDCAGRFTVQASSESNNAPVLTDANLTTGETILCTQCADGYVLVEKESNEESHSQVCRTCAPPWMAFASVSTSIFICVPIVAWTMNRFQLWMASHSSNAVDEAEGQIEGARDFLSLVRTMTSVITHLQLTQLQLSLNLKWPAWLKLAIGVISWPFTFNFNFVTSTEAFCWTSLVSPGNQLLVLLAIPLVLGLSSFLIAYIPNRKEVTRDTKHEKTKRPPYSSCCSAAVGCCCSQRDVLCNDDPKVKMAALFYLGIVALGLIMLVENLLCGLGWLGSQQCII